MIEPATTPIDRHGIFFAGTRAHADACESGHLHTQSRPRRPGSSGRAEDSRGLIAGHRNVASSGPLRDCPDRESNRQRPDHQRSLRSTCAFRKVSLGECHFGQPPHELVGDDRMGVADAADVKQRVGLGRHRSVSQS
jgi:hypothetical protein